MAPVTPPEIHKGQDARAALRLTDSALKTANTRLLGSAAWYEAVRQDYSGK